jgi:hypothetical protein
MVGNRPVTGVRNPVCSTSPCSYLRAKNVGSDLPESGGTTDPVKEHPTVSPVQLTEAAMHPE